MKSIHVSLILMVLRACQLEAKPTKNIPVWEIGSNPHISGNRIEYNDPECDSSLECRTSKGCAAKGTKPTLTEDKKYFACCAIGQRLLGSAQTAFDCCAKGHDLVGTEAHGYHCCPTGMEFDGTICKVACSSGKSLVNGKCVCPQGQVEGTDGQCKEKTKEKAPDMDADKNKPTQCDSGLETGKCYIFIAENGNKLGLRPDNVYYAAPDSMTQRYGKFQLCGDTECKAGKPINPSMTVYIRDTYGDLATGAHRGQWLNNAQNGKHVGRTPSAALAGKFSISKWPFGKYCVGGFETGLGPACPAEIPALTFYSQDAQMCVAFELVEVPCDIKNDANNCVWKTGEQFGKGR